MQTLFFTLRGIILSILLLINALIWASWILLFGSLIRLLPCQSLRLRGMQILYMTPTLWTDINRWLLWPAIGRKLQVHGHATLSTKNWYLLIANHQSWMDILILSIAFNRKIPFLKFFMKKQLLWTLPVIGLACHYLGYPLMARHSKEQIRKNPALKGKDAQTTHKACAQVKLHPTTLLNFPEGTRFSEEKKARQQAPFRHLLKPKAGGTAIALYELRDQLTGIVNTTVCYQLKNLSLWRLICGYSQKIDVYFELLPITPELIGDYHENREFRAHFQQWLNQVWQEKDDFLQSL